MCIRDRDQIAGRMGSDLQMMSFSATIPNGLKPFLKKYMKQPQTVQIESSEHFQPQIRHVLVPCRHMSYTQKQMEVLKGIQPYVCLIFANTRLMAAQTAEAVSYTHLDVYKRQDRFTHEELGLCLSGLRDLRRLVQYVGLWSAGHRIQG